MGLGFLSSLFGGGKKKDEPAPIPTPAPVAPTIDNAAENAAKKLKQRKESATQSVYTNPLGVQGTADVAKKTLLGA